MDSGSDDQLVAHNSDEKKWHEGHEQSLFLTSLILAIVAAIGLVLTLIPFFSGMAFMVTVVGALGSSALLPGIFLFMFDVAMLLPLVLSIRYMNRVPEERKREGDVLGGYCLLGRIIRLLIPLAINVLIIVGFVATYSVMFPVAVLLIFYCSMFEYFIAYVHCVGVSVMSDRSSWVAFCLVIASVVMQFILLTFPAVGLAVGFTCPSVILSVLTYFLVIYTMLMSGTAYNVKHQYTEVYDRLSKVSNRYSGEAIKDWNGYVLLPDNKTLISKLHLESGVFDAIVKNSNMTAMSDVSIHKRTKKLEVVRNSNWDFYVHNSPYPTKNLFYG